MPDFRKGLANRKRVQIDGKGDVVRLPPPTPPIYTKRRKNRGRRREINSTDWE